MMNLLRRIASLPGLRSVLLRPRVRAFLASLLSVRFLRVARLTTTPVGFVVADLITRRGQVRRYRLRSGADVVLRHRVDTEAFHEIHLAGEYEPPSALADRLSGPLTILDVGGNVGLFANWAAARWPGSQVVSFEPVPSNIATFREWLDSSTAPVTLVEAAAMTSAGHASVSTDRGSGSQVVVDGSGDVEAVDLFDHLADADFAKIDIEGGEWPILLDPRLAEVRDLVLVLEYHRGGAPALPARDTAERLLADAGFTTGFVRPNHWGHGILWAWKPPLVEPAR